MEHGGMTLASYGLSSQRLHIKDGVLPQSCCGQEAAYTNFNRVCIILYNSIVPVMARKAEACNHRSLLLDTQKLGCALSAIDNCQLAPI